MSILQETPPLNPKIIESLSLKADIVSDSELNELNRILSSDLIPAFINDIQRCKWNTDGVKRKVKNEKPNGESKYTNKYGLDYKRKEKPFLVIGINECVRALENDNLRILIINKIGKTFLLADNLISLCCVKQIPIIPVKYKQSELSSFLNESHIVKTVRMSCFGITNVEPPSRSLLSSLVYLEDYYKSNMHISLPFTTPVSLSVTSIKHDPKSKSKHMGHNKPFLDREQKHHVPVFQRINLEDWTRKQIANSLIEGYKMDEGKESKLVKEKQVIQVKQVKQVIQVKENKKVEDIKEDKKEIKESPKETKANEKTQLHPEKKEKTKSKPTLSLKQKLKSNPLFRFK